MTRRLMSFAVLGVVLGTYVVGQQPAAPVPPPDAAQQPPVTFRVEVNYVEVDAVVTDARGLFVSELSRDDFQILEDGKPQAISSFSMVNIPRERPERPLFADAPLEPDVRTNEREYDGRIYVILLDDLHIGVERSGHVRALVRQFIERNLGTNDLVAIGHTSGRTDAAQEFTNSPRLLVRAVDKFRGQKLRSPTLDRLDEYRRRLNTRRDGDPAPTAVDDPNELQRGYQAQAMLDTLKKTTEFLTGIRGRRKALVLVSEGIDYDVYDPINTSLSNSGRSSFGTAILDDIRDVIAAATRANVSIFSVDPRGLTGFGSDLVEIQAPADNPNLDLGPNTLLADLRLSQDSLRVLSEQTGGVAYVGTNALDRALDEIVEQNSSYYLLGYYPDNDRRDGRFRKIEVRVRRPGVQVRARRGYVAPRGRAPRPATAADGKSTVPAELRALIDNPLPVSGLTLSTAVAPFRGDDQNASVAITVQVSPDQLKFTERDGAYVNRLELALVAVDKDAAIRGGDQLSFDLNLKPDTYQRVAEGGFRVLSRVALPAGRYQLRVAGRETGGGATGSVYTEIDVPDFTKEPLALSGLVLASAAEVQNTLTARPDPQFVDVLPGPPTTDRVFDADAAVALYAEVYDNVTTPAHKIDLATTVRADAGEVVFRHAEERDTADLQGRRGGFGYSVRIPLDQMATGLYVLRVSATSRLKSDSPVYKEIPFRIR